MPVLFDIKEYPVRDVLKTLLKDRTTKRNIIFATDAYVDVDPRIDQNTEMTEALLLDYASFTIQPRVSKSLEKQTERTRKKAEVFTPSWICNKMNNHCDTEWFGREGVFNQEKDNDWQPTEDPIDFTGTEGWKAYIDSKRLEITCGEAPYIVSRYDATSGEIISVERRIGILDRKLRVVNENTSDEKEWLKWTFRSFESVYGYEFQGDNLLIARINLLMTFIDYVKAQWNREPTGKELERIAKIVSWNLWQMDGIKGTVPFSSAQPEYEQLTFFDFIGGGVAESKEKDEPVECLIYDWRAKEKMTYNSLKKG